MGGLWSTLQALNRAEADLVVVDDRGQDMTLSLMVSAESVPRIQWYELEPPAAETNATPRR